MKERLVMVCGTSADAERVRERQKKVLESVSPFGQALLGKEGVDFPHSFHFLGLGLQHKRKRGGREGGRSCLFVLKHEITGAITL